MINFQYARANDVADAPANFVDELDELSCVLLRERDVGEDLGRDRLEGTLVDSTSLWRDPGESCTSIGRVRTATT